MVAVAPPALAPLADAADHSRSEGGGGSWCGSSCINGAPPILRPVWVDEGRPLTIISV